MTRPERGSAKRGTPGSERQEENMWKRQHAKSESTEAQRWLALKCLTGKQGAGNTEAASTECRSRREP